jgi:hypothetical protein
MSASPARIALAGLAVVILPGLFLSCSVLLFPRMAYPLADPSEAWVGAGLAAVQGCMLSLIGCAFVFLIWRVLHFLKRANPCIFAIFGLIAGLAEVYLNPLQTPFWKIAYPIAGTLTGLSVWAIAYAPGRSRYGSVG